MPRLKPKTKSQPRNSDLSQELAVLTERVDQNHKALGDQFEAGMQLVLEKLKPIEDLKAGLAAQAKLVQKHSAQINYWRGALVIVSVLWTAVLTTAVAWGAAVLKRGH